MNIKHKSGIRFDRLRDKLGVIDAAVDDIGKLLKDADLVSLKIDINLLKSSEYLKLNLTKLSTLVSHELIKAADYGSRIVSGSYNIKALGSFWCYSKISELESNILKKNDSNKKSDFGTTTTAAVRITIKESKAPGVVKRFIFRSSQSRSYNIYSYFF